MFLQVVLVTGVALQASLALELASPSSFLNQKTTTLRDLNKQAMDRQIQSSLLGKGTGNKIPVPPIPGSSFFRKGVSNGPIKLASEAECSIPLTRMEIDNTKRFAVKSFKVPGTAFNSMAKAPSAPACKN